MKSIRIALFALALSSAAAQAADSTALQASLAADGMTPIGEGLYGRRDGGDEAYVAYTPAGQQTLLNRLLELRAANPAAARTAGAMPTPLDRLIEQLSDSGPSLGRFGDTYGDCNGAAASGPFHVQASASGGRTASASAQNTSTPAINTTNTAYAIAADEVGSGPEQFSTTQGNTPAVASASTNPRFACLSQSAATVTCPGATRPAIAAFANSQANPNLPCRF